MRSGQIRLAVAACLLCAAAGGCGGGTYDSGGCDKPVAPQPGPPFMTFVSWDSIAPGQVRGRIDNQGLEARNVRVRLWYAVGQSETARVVVPEPSDVPVFGSATFVAPSQSVRGEARFPRIGGITWEGGSSAEQPRAPLIVFNTGKHWCWIGPDTVVAFVANYGGWAYRVAVTVETRNGVVDVSPRPDRIAPALDSWFLSAGRESSGVMLLPRVLKFRWEDYGGIQDSVVSPPVDYLAFPERCYWGTR
jgi:hypothetical protein